MGKYKKMVLIPLEQLEDSDIVKTNNFLKKTIGGIPSKFGLDKKINLLNNLKKYNEFYGTHFSIKFEYKYEWTKDYYCIFQIKGGVETSQFKKIKTKVINSVKNFKKNAEIFLSPAYNHTEDAIERENAMIAAAGGYEYWEKINE